MSEKPVLKPCPFGCGKAVQPAFANLMSDKDMDDCPPMECWTIFHECAVIGSTIVVEADTEAAAIAAWNRRAALAAADQWLPIESAPRDGTAILLYCPTFYFGAGVYVGWWGGSYFEVCTEGQTPHPYSDDGATHWRPLPQPPKATTHD